MPQHLAQLQRVFRPFVCAGGQPDRTGNEERLSGTSSRRTIFSGSARYPRSGGHLDIGRVRQQRARRVQRSRWTRSTPRSSRCGSRYPEPVDPRRRVYLQVINT